MVTLLNTPLTTPHQFTPVLSISEPLQFDDGMVGRHTCPCCASLLLRHISQSHVYWRCSHCRAPMSAWRQWT
jgi:ribosomal protein L37AE/L43A